MSERTPDAPDRGRDPLTSFPLRLLAVLLFVECAGLSAITALLLVELLVETPDSYGSAIGLTVLSAIGAVFLALIAINTLRGRSWVRGAAITVQVLSGAIAIGAFQGLFARPDIGWLLLAPALAILVLLFTPPVLAATTRRD